MVKMFSFLFLFEHFTYLLVKPQRLTWKYLYDYSDEIKKKLCPLLALLWRTCHLVIILPIGTAEGNTYLPTYLPTASYFYVNWWPMHVCETVFL